MITLDLSPENLSSAGRMPIGAPSCLTCTTLLSYHKDLRYSTWWYKCKSCGWSGTGVDVLCRAWNIELQDIGKELDRSRLIVENLDELIAMSMVWKELSVWIGSRLDAPEPEDETTIDLMKKIVPSLNQVDWPTWKTGAGRFVFLTSLSDLPKGAWSGSEIFSKREPILAAAIVDEMERPVGLWVHGTRESLLFPESVNKRNRSGYVYLNEMPSTAVIVPGRVSRIIDEKVRYLRTKGIDLPIVPFVWPHYSRPDPYVPVNATECHVMAFEGETASASLVLAKKRSTLFVVQKELPPGKAYISKKFQPMAWDDYIISAARKQGDLVKAWSLHIGLVGDNLPLPEFIRSKNEDLYREICCGYRDVTRFGDRVLWREDDGIYIRGRSNSRFRITTRDMVTNADLRIVAIAVGESKGIARRRRIAICVGRIEGKEFRFSVPLKEVGTGKFAAAAVMSAADNLLLSLYVNNDYYNRLGSIVLAMSRPGEISNPHTWGWSEEISGFYLGKCTIVKGGVKILEPRRLSMVGPYLRPGLGVYPRRKFFRKHMDTGHQIPSSIWAIAAVFLASMIARNPRYRLQYRTGIVADSMDTIEWIINPLMGIMNITAMSRIPGWPRVYTSGSGGRSDIFIKSRIATLEMLMEGRCPACLVFPDAAILPSDVYKKCCQYLIPAYLEYAMKRGLEDIPKKDSMAGHDLTFHVLEDLGRWFASIGGSCNSINLARRRIVELTGSSGDIMRRSVRATMAMKRKNLELRITPDRAIGIAALSNVFWWREVSDHFVNYLVRLGIIEERSEAMISGTRRFLTQSFYDYLSEEMPEDIFLNRSASLVGRDQCPPPNASTAPAELSQTHRLG